MPAHIRAAPTHLSIPVAGARSIRRGRERGFQSDADIHHVCPVYCAHPVSSYAGLTRVSCKPLKLHRINAAGDARITSAHDDFYFAILVSRAVTTPTRIRKQVEVSE